MIIMNQLNGILVVYYKFKENNIIDEIPLELTASTFHLANTQSNLTLTIHQSSPSKVHNNNTVNQNYTPPNKSPKIISNNDLALSGFMEHLQAELSIENVLPFIELVQRSEQVTEQKLRPRFNIIYIYKYTSNIYTQLGRV